MPKAGRAFKIIFFRPDHDSCTAVMPSEAINVWKLRIPGSSKITNFCDLL